MKTAFQVFFISVLMGVVLLLISCGTTQQAADTDADVAATGSPFSFPPLLKWLPANWSSR